MGAAVRHVLHVVYRFDTGGLENGLVNLINHLGEEQYRHSIVTMRGHSAEFARRIRTHNVEIYDLGKRDGNDLGVYLRLNRLLKQLKPDILHTRNTATLEMQLVGWWRRVPLRIHGEHGWDVHDMHGGNPRYRKLRRWMRPFVHQYVALSTEARDYLLNVIEVPGARVNHICNGVDDKRFVPTDHVASGHTVIGCVGRLAEVKNHRLLAQAFALLHRRTDRPVRLHLIGEGACRSAVEKILSENGCAHDTWLPGDRDDVPQLMAGFDIFVLPSLAEGISNTILEAMACGLPVVAARVGGNPDLVEHGKTGFLLESDDIQQFADAIGIYVDDTALRRAHGTAGRLAVEQRFSIDAMTRSYDALYHIGKEQ